MEYVIAIFGLGLIVTFVVFVGLVQAAETVKANASEVDRDGK